MPTRLVLVGGFGVAGADAGRRAGAFRRARRPIRRLACRCRVTVGAEGTKSHSWNGNTPLTPCGGVCHDQQALQSGQRLAG